MKKIYIPFLLALICSCNNATKETMATSVSQPKVNSSVKATKTDSIAKTDTAPVKISNDPIEKLQGVWTKKIGENASFQIDKKTFYYPDHSAHYKYTVFGDSLKINYDDGYDATFAFEFKGDDILMMSGETGSYTYYRVKK